MKLVKMSLLAATLIASSAFAIDNVKVSGDAKLYYGTSDNDDLAPTGDASLFNKNGAYGQAAAKVGLTADLTDGVSAGVSIVGLSTLGLEGQLVNGVWEATNGVSDSFWFDEAWVAGTAGKTTAKVGRMTLDTPLVFTETWSIVENTFEAAVLLNQDIPDTTLVAAYVGGSNGGNLLAPAVIAPQNPASNTNFSQFYNGAFAFGAVNNSWTPMTIQGWYYSASSVADAWWLQADFAFDFGLVFGAEYTNLDMQNVAGTGLVNDSNNAWAVMLGYDKKDTFKITGAYSQTGTDKNYVGAGMNLSASGQSKLYTEAWWNYGYITRADTSSFNITAATAEELTWAGLAIYYTQATVGKNGSATDLKQDMSEITLEATKSYGPLDTSLLYIYTDAEDQNKGDSYNTIQAYLTYNF